MRVCTVLQVNQTYRTCLW